MNSKGLSFEWNTFQKFCIETIKNNSNALFTAPRSFGKAVFQLHAMCHAIERDETKCTSALLLVI